MDKVGSTLARIQGQRVYLDTNIFIYFFERMNAILIACSLKRRATSQRVSVQSV